MTKASRINLPICVFAVPGLVGTPIHVIAVVTHALRIVFLVGMRTVSDALNFLLSKNTGVHLLELIARLHVCH